MESITQKIEFLPSELSDEESDPSLTVLVLDPYLIVLIQDPDTSLTQLVPDTSLTVLVRIHP